MLKLLIVAVPFCILLLAGCYFPKNIEGPAIEKKLHGWEDWRDKSHPGLKLHIFNTGMNKVSSLLVGEHAPWRPAPAFLIEHPQQGLIIFDTGLSSVIAQEQEAALHPITRLLSSTRSLPGKDLPSQMKSAAFEPAQVKRVVFSHMHFDHIGNSQAFTNANYYLGGNTDIEGLSRMGGGRTRYHSRHRGQKFSGES